SKSRQSSNVVPSGPDEPAVFREDVLNHLLVEELESAGMQAQRLASSPPRSPILTHSLSPLKRTNRNLSSEHSIHLKPSTISRRNRSLSEADGPPSPARDDSSRSESTLWTCRTTFNINQTF
ncbi:hypothetical protein XENOCAPTIV_019004, partial [Xenoophorus captivus]